MRIAQLCVSDYHRLMFFTLSKFFWFIVEPSNVILLLISVGALMIFSPWWRAGRVLVSLAAISALGLAILPIGNISLVELENRFPVAVKLPPRVDGIIALGGVASQFVTRSRGQISLGGAVERLTEFASLSRRYPDAKLVFTGGSGYVFRQDIKEADVLGPFFKSLGMDVGRIIFENRSRNTFENAVNTFELVKPGADETWILITSAFHMPRAFGTFRKAGWNIIPYPVDFYFEGNEMFSLSFNLGAGMSRFAAALHEWLGLAFYRLTGKSDVFFPAPVGQ